LTRVGAAVISSAVVAERLMLSLILICRTTKIQYADWRMAKPAENPRGKER
jgi:hypothetical protein